MSVGTNVMWLQAIPEAKAIVIGINDRVAEKIIPRPLGIEIVVLYKRRLVEALAELVGFYTYN